MNTERKSGRPVNSKKMGVDYFPVFLELEKQLEFIVIFSKYKQDGYTLIYRLFNLLSSQNNFRILLYDKEKERDKSSIIADFVWLSVDRFKIILDDCLLEKIFVLEDGYLSCPYLDRVLTPILEKREYNSIRKRGKTAKKQLVVAENQLVATENQLVVNREEKSREEKSKEENRKEEERKEEKVAGDEKLLPPSPQTSDFYLASIPQSFITKLNKEGFSEDIITSAAVEYFNKENKYFRGERDKLNYFRAFCRKILERESSEFQKSSLSGLLNEIKEELSLPPPKIVKNPDKRSRIEIYRDFYKLTDDDIKLILEEFEQLHGKSLDSSDSNDDLYIDLIKFDELCENFALKKKVC